MNSLSPTSIEHACWYLDWRSQQTPVPENVNMVNVFVGTIGLKDGKPYMGGFEAITLPELKAFAADCAAKDIKVKVSIGGSGGSYDNCWDVLTSENIQEFAQMMVDFCHEYNLAGVDFDYEEFKAEQEPLVGQLIKEFRTLGPDLQASLCTNAGSYWQKDVQRILDPTKVNGKSLLSRLYIMDYTGTLEIAEGYVTPWISWVKDNYKMSPSQVTVGMAGLNGPTYSLADFSEWTAKEGLSTNYWAWDPAAPSTSNERTLEILSNYKTMYNKTHPVHERVIRRMASIFQKVSSKLHCCCR